jgi:hypothetical protein
MLVHYVLIIYLYHSITFVNICEMNLCPKKRKHLHKFRSLIGGTSYFGFGDNVMTINATFNNI